MAGRRSLSVLSWLIAVMLLAAVTLVGYAISQRFQIVLVQDDDGRSESPLIPIAEPVRTPPESSPRPGADQQLEPAVASAAGKEALDPTPNDAVDPVMPTASALDADLGPDSDPDLDVGGRRAFQAMTDADQSVVDQPSGPPNQRATLRTWTDLRGKFSVRAKLIKQSRRSVTLERDDNGKRITILIRRLSKTDQAYLGALAEQATNASATFKPTPQSGHTLVGRVIRVSDGDTIDMIDPGSGEHRIRLEGIDAPEYTQPYGREARKWLADQIAGKPIRVEIVEKDRYDRWAGHVYDGDRWINGLLVSHGWAWHYHHFSDDPRLATAQRQARASRLGLWQDPKPVAPWKYREQQEATVGFEPTNR